MRIRTFLVSFLTVPNASRIVRSLSAIVVIALCLGGIYFAGKTGLSRLFSEVSGRLGNLQAATFAVQVSPSDAEAHYARARALMEENPAEAKREFERAVLLRPDDYVLWVELSRARERLGDRSGAIEDARQALLRAPYYSQTHWELGNLLLRNGDSQQGFAELKLAAVSDPRQLPALVDLCWQVYQGDTAAIEQAIQPRSDIEYLALAQCFRKHAEIPEGIKMLRSAGLTSSKQERGIWIKELITGKHFTEAYEIWTWGNANASAKDSLIFNGGFEDDILSANAGFNWLAGGDNVNLKLSRDTSNPLEGRYSLRVQFNGLSAPESPILSQLVLTEPGTRYRLQFHSRTANIVSGGLPEVLVRDATASDQHALGEPQLMTNGTSDWREYDIDFVTGASTRAVQVMILRKACGAECPIFGDMWLDSFALRKVGSSDKR